MWNFAAEENLNTESSYLGFTTASMVSFAGTSRLRIFGKLKLEVLCFVLLKGAPCHEQTSVRAEVVLRVSGPSEALSVFHQSRVCCTFLNAVFETGGIL